MISSSWVNVEVSAELMSEVIGARRGGTASRDATCSFMKVDHLKVRPKKCECHTSTWAYPGANRNDVPLSPAKGVAPCAIQLAKLLNCWASRSDLQSTGPCAEAAQDLRLCMRGALRAMPTSVSGITNVVQLQGIARAKPRKHTINYHLARIGKQI